MSLVAVMNTDKGSIRLDLYADRTPKTVANFVNLVQRGFYDGLNFHRVIDDFMVQGGCPLGTGTGGPGYRFGDEFDQSLRHDAPGKLSMANAGPGTNGSQFFITHVSTPWLDDAHTVFGAVQSEADQDVVVRRHDPLDQPAELLGNWNLENAECGADREGHQHNDATRNQHRRE